eukprot:8384280-Pyramimonas_sp.AAC.1
MIPPPCPVLDATRNASGHRAEGEQWDSVSTEFVTANCTSWASTKQLPAPDHCPRGVVPGAQAHQRRGYPQSAGL